MSQLQLTARRTVLGLLTFALAITGLTVTAGIAAAGPTVTKDHVLTMSVDYDLREFSPDTDDSLVKANNTQTSKTMKIGTASPRTYRLWSPSTPYGGYSSTKIVFAENDSTGMLKASVTSMLILHGWIRAQTTIDYWVPANTTRSIYIYTDDGLHSYSHDKVTITNLITK